MSFTKRYILTGTPGAGKTTILRQLETLGYSVVEEAATAIIALEQGEGIARPWDEEHFLDKIVALQIQRQVQTAPLPLAVQFFDRSPLDVYALSLFLNRPVPAILTAELERMQSEKIFQKQVFFIENLGFCEPTEARKISFEESLRFEKLHEEVYQAAGYTCVRIAPKSVAERVNDILNVIHGI